MTAQEVTRKYSLEIVVKDGVEQIGTRSKVSASDLDYIRANKAEIIEAIKAARAAVEQAEQDRIAATVTFTVVGWESHQVSIDTRKDIDEQCAKIASYYPDDMTAETVKAAYIKHIEAAKATEAAKNQEEQEAKETEQNAIRLAASTGEKQKIKSWLAECNDPREECSTDVITLWAMPDGTISKTREHTW